MKKLIHRAETRGIADHVWLYSRHTFSFAAYYNPERMRFGLLRVLNDDIVEPGMGFGKHPHDNMEIVSIPLSGALAHKDTTGREEVIQTGDVQIMSAGSGLLHSEYNASKNDPVNFLQLWVFPKEKNIQPRYDQKSYPLADRQNRIQTVVSPSKESGTLWINQDAWFSLGSVDTGNSLDYKVNLDGNGVYIFVISGKIEVDGDTLKQRDGMGISEVEEVHISAEEDSELLFVEVPMN